tara:strand:- start:1177 stop:1833 length:657 start_codon:yes stop_codon:yes gene_type:complete
MYNADVLVIIPAFNEAKTIERVINVAHQYADVLVMDDASTDSTREIAIKYNAKVISNNTNLGYESNLSKGIALACREKHYSYFLTIDADGEHDANDIRRFIEELKSGFHLVCGNRSYKNRFSEKVWGFIANLLYGIKDPLCGLKGYSSEFVDNTLSSHETNILGSLVGTYLTKIMLNNGCSYSNININVSKREGASKFGDGIQVNFSMIRELIKFIKL